MAIPDYQSLMLPVLKAVAEIEKQSAARIRKLTVVPAYFLQAPQSQDNDKPTQDSIQYVEKAD